MTGVFGAVVAVIAYRHAKSRARANLQHDVEIAHDKAARGVENLTDLLPRALKSIRATLSALDGVPPGTMEMFTAENEEDLATVAVLRAAVNGIARTRSDGTPYEQLMKHLTALNMLQTNIDQLTTKYNTAMTADSRPAPSGLARPAERPEVTERPRMNKAVIPLLVIIAVAVGYLAYSEYQSRQAAADVVDRLTDPEGYVARQWSENAGLECDVITDVRSQSTPSGVMRPLQFTCIASTGSWTIEDVECPAEPPTWARGSPKEVGQMYKPLAVICWTVRGRT